MGNLEEYYVIESVVKYDDDPFKFGRIKCDIPGVIDSNTTMPEAMPWIRPLRMNGYQTFSRPLIGEKVWVLISKTNYNEYWWTHFYETIDIVQEFLDEHYDNQPDVFHARNTCSCDVMSTFDDERGYYTKIGLDYVNLKMNREMEIAFNNCRIKIEGDKIYCGHNDEEYAPSVNGKKYVEMFEKMSSACDTLIKSLNKDPLQLLGPGLNELKSAINDANKTLCQHHFVN